jgi:hypothetical protein
MPDAEHSPQRSGERFRDAVADIVASAGTGLVDFAATGTPSAGALAPMVALGMRLGSDALNRRRDRGARALEAAAADVGGLERLEELATGDDTRMELTARTLEAAMRTTLEAKVRALGKVLAAGLDGRATVDEAQVLTAALAAKGRPAPGRRLSRGGPLWDTQPALREGGLRDSKSGRPGIAPYPDDARGPSRKWRPIANAGRDSLRAQTRPRRGRSGTAVIAPTDAGQRLCQHPPHMAR